MCVLFLNLKYTGWAQNSPLFPVYNHGTAETLETFNIHPYFINPKRFCTNRNNNKKMYFSGRIDPMKYVFGGKLQRISKDTPLSGIAQMGLRSDAIIGHSRLVIII